MTTEREAMTLEKVRRCYKCKTDRAASYFYANQNMCKSCQNERDRRRRQLGLKSNVTAAARARKRHWQATHDTSSRDKARRAVRLAVNNGALVRQTMCECCGESPKRADGVTAVQAHHDDYAKPLEVRWLCAKCHTKWHLENPEA